MPWKYFFDQDTVIHSGVEISAYETNKIENNVKRVLEVAHGGYLLEAIRYLFQMSFTDIFEMCKKSNMFMKMLIHLFENTCKNSLICKIMFQPVYSTTKISSCVHGHIAIIVIDNLEITVEEAKNVIASILDGGRIHDLISSAKCSLIFDYEPVDIDSIESCFAEIHQRNDISTIIPLYSYNNAPESFNVPTTEKNSIACRLTKLLIIISKILTEYSGSSNYLEIVDKNYNQDIVLLGKINTRCSDFINRLRNKAVHKMKNEINIFMYLLIQLEKLLREKEVTSSGWNREYEDCMKNLKSLYHWSLIPKSDAWIQIQDSCLLLSENCENWKYRVIWPLGEQLPPYYDMEELSTYSWVVDSKTKETEPRLIINGEKYYFGMAEIEENGWKNTFSRSNIKNILKYAFRDKDELCKSITCPCSPAKKRLWLCERCLWLVRMHGPTGVSCRCRKTTMKKMKVYCNGCKTDIPENAKEVMVDDEMKAIEQQQILNDIKINVTPNEKLEEDPVIVMDKRNKENRSEGTVTMKELAKDGLLANLSKNKLKSNSNFTVLGFDKSHETTILQLSSEITSPETDVKKNESKQEINRIEPSREIDSEHKLSDKLLKSRSNNTDEHQVIRPPTPPPRRQSIIPQDNHKASESHHSEGDAEDSNQIPSLTSKIAMDEGNQWIEHNVPDVNDHIKLIDEVKESEITGNTDGQISTINSNSPSSTTLLEITEEQQNQIPPHVDDQIISSPQEFTVIFLGESGVGKSTLISGLGNYLNWPTFEEAKKNQMQVCIPLQFKVQRRGVDKKIIETIVTAGDPEDNENFNDTGQSVTQQPKVHQFTFQENTVKFIDTPGLSDSRGAEQDKKNLELIRECIHNQKEIHAICIVLKSNDARLRPEFELALRDLLSLFPKPALKNVFFFFTYASGTFFGIGDSTGPVKEMQKKIQDSHEETYSFEGENTCAIDSESFKFLLCEERGVKYSNRPEEDFDFCWNESAAQVKDFLTFIKTVKPIEKKTTLAVHYLATAALNLEEFIRNSDQLTPEKRDNLVNESKIILNVAKKWSMVTEYHRLKTDLEHWNVDEFPNSCEKCEQLVNSVDKKVSEELFTHVKKAWEVLTLKSAIENIDIEEENCVDCPPETREVFDKAQQPQAFLENRKSSVTDRELVENVNSDENHHVSAEINTKNDVVNDEPKVEEKLDQSTPSPKSTETNTKPTAAPRHLNNSMSSTPESSIPKVTEE